MLTYQIVGRNVQYMTVTEELNVADSAEKTGVGVLDKSVAIIDLVERGPATLAEIGAELGATSSTIHRLVNALTKHGFVRRGLDGRYYPGRRFSQAALVDTAQPVLRELRDQSGESAQLWVRRGAYRLSLASVESNDPLRVVLEVGSAVPLGEGSAALVLQGQFDREVGYVATEGTRVAGIGSVSAPVVVGGEIIAAVCLAGPLYRIQPNPAERYGDLVKEAAKRIQATLPDPESRTL
jgi:DNA-binding IclR family transcriptional regulator